MLRTHEHEMLYRECNSSILPLMPELPEVENVRLGLTALLSYKPSVAKVTVHRRDLRVQVPLELEELLVGQRLKDVRRRAKYLLLDFDNHTVISHLGMSGAWRIGKTTERRKHDHVEIEFTESEKIIFHDPRRFGLIEIVKLGAESSSKWLKHLGIEPLDDKFNGEYLKTAAKGKKTAVKTLIMDQKIVVGVGNIYASEALYLAKIRPQRSVAKIKLQEWKALAKSIQRVLLKSIKNGGTTLRDYAQVNGDSGGNQFRLSVYDRAKEACRKCKTNIRVAVQVGRSTYWCPECQR